MERDCKNALLMKELRPWLIEFKKLGTRGKNTLTLMRDFKDGKYEAFWNGYINNRMSTADMAAYQAHKSGTMKLQPFYENGMDDMAVEFFKKVAGKTPAFYKGMGTYNSLSTTQNKLMLDNDSTTFYHSGASQKLGNWYGTKEAKAPIPNKNTYGRSNYYLELADKSYYVKTLPILFPELMNIEKCEELPDAEAYKTYSGENTIFTVVPIMSSLFDSGQLNLGRNKLPASELKKKSKLLNLPEFFTDGNKYFSNICASFVLNFYTIYCMDLYNNDLTEKQDLLKDLFKNLDEMQEYLMPVLLPHITGFRKNMFDYCSCGYQINVLQSVLKEFHKEGWLPIDKLLFHCRVSPKNTESQFLLLYYSDLLKANFCNEYDGKELFCDDTIQELTYPYLKCSCYLFFQYRLQHAYHRILYIMNSIIDD